MRELLLEGARWHDRESIVYGLRRRTFAEQLAAIQHARDVLREYGVTQGDRVAIFASNSPEWVAVFFAVLELGAVVVPCNGWWSEEEMAHACKTTDPTLIVFDERRVGRIPPDFATASLASFLTDTSSTESRDRHVQPELRETDPAVILFTAGTTGLPKGAVLSHRALISNIQNLLVVSKKLPNMLSDSSEPSVTLVGLPLFHIGAIQLVILPLVSGGKIVFLDGRFDAERVLRLIQDERVTMFSGVPTMMERMLQSPAAQRLDLSSLRTIVLGGSPVSTDLLDRAVATFPNAVRGMGRAYGLTEAGGVVSTAVGADIRSHPGSSGKLLPVVEAMIADPDSRHEGELLVRTPGAMEGYWGVAHDETIDSDGWIHTGDIGRMDADGYLYITGRLKDVIIRGGENVAAPHVESVLKRHPDVAEVAVVGLPDEDLGESVAAALVPDRGKSLDEAELDRFARAHLAHFEIPAHWWIRAEGLPLNDAGKIVKHELVHNWPR